MTPDRLIIGILALCLATLGFLTILFGGPLSVIGFILLLAGGIGAIGAFFGGSYEQ